MLTAVSSTKRRKKIRNKEKEEGNDGEDGERGRGRRRRKTRLRGSGRGRVGQGGEPSAGARAGSKEASRNRDCCQYDLGSKVKLKGKT